MGPLEWKSYLQGCSRQIIEDGDDAGSPTLPETVVQSGWLGYEGASPKAIQQAEIRLGVRLPPSLRLFYSVTNGWRTVGCFIWEVLPLEKLGWIADLETDMWEMAVSLEEQNAHYERVDLREWAYEEGTRVKRSLVIAQDGDASTWLLDPLTVSAKGEWSGGRWSSWNPGMEWVAGSFEQLFRDEYETYLRLRAEEQ